MLRKDLIDYLKSVNLEKVKVEISGAVLDIDSLEIKGDSVLLITKKNPYVVTKLDLIEDLRGLELETVQRMVDCQVEQGNEPDVTVFQRSSGASKKQGGFDWELTKEGDNRWYEKIMG